MSPESHSQDQTARTPERLLRAMPNPQGPVNHLVVGPRESDIQNSSHTFEDFLLEVERCILDSGNLFLFTGDQPRVSVMLLRHERSPRVIWGVKRHEDWAFKATLLRLSRSSHAVHLILSTDSEGDDQLRGWVVHRNVNAFWASPLSTEHARRFWTRCLESLVMENAGSI